MKKIAALLLLMAFAAQTFSQGIIILNFYIHQSYIAKTQCENRYRPMLHCNGKCILAKKLKQQENKDQQNPELKLSGKSEVFTSQSFFINTCLVQSSFDKSHFFSSDNGTIDATITVFHPPCI
ncbi:MAG: hypothetical protein ACHQEB_00365 [Chitinophagales bacterium]